MSADDEAAEMDEKGQAAPEPQVLKRGRGRPRFVPTPAQRMLVRSMAANRVPQEIIARNVLRSRDDLDGIDPTTLRAVFRRELDEGYERTVASMGMAVVKSGLSGNVGAQKYWLQTHGGEEWKTTENVRHGLTPDTQSALGNNSLIAPVLVIQPVKSIEVPKPNGHDPHHLNGGAPHEDRDEASA